MAHVLPFPSRPVQRASCPCERAGPAQVVNLWVRRQEAARAAEENAVVWRCHCDSLLWLYYAVEGLVCAKCGKKSTERPR